MSVLQHNASNRETAARTTGAMVLLLCTSLALCGCIERTPKGDFAFQKKADLEDATQHSKDTQTSSADGQSDANDDGTLPCKVTEDCHKHSINQCWQWICDTWGGVKQCLQEAMNDVPCSDPDKCIGDGQGKCSSDGQCLGPSCPSGKQCENQVCTDKRTVPNNCKDDCTTVCATKPVNKDVSWKIETITGEHKNNDGPVDGAVGKAAFSVPSGIAITNDGTIYISDSFDHVIRVIDAKRTTVSTIAGTFGEEGHVDGNGAVVRFSTPDGMAVGPDQAIFIADRDNQVIRRLDHNGQVTTIAGTVGESGHQNGKGTTAKFDDPIALAFRADKAGESLLYIVDHSSHSIRTYNFKDEQVAHLAGHHTWPSEKNCDTDKEINCPVIDGELENATFFYPAGIAVGRTEGAPNKYLYVTEWSHRIRRIDLDQRIVTTFAGDGSADHTDGEGVLAKLNWPSGIAADADGDMYFTSLGNNVVREVSATGVVESSIGQVSGGAFSDGWNQLAQFSDPSRLAVHCAHGLIVVDKGNRSIRRITPACANAFSCIEAQCRCP
jgi:hypothetical protein